MYTKISISTWIFWSLFLQVGINILSPNNKPVKLIFYSFIFNFSLKDIVHMAKNIQECFEDWNFNLLLILSNNFSTDNSLEMTICKKLAHKNHHNCIP